MAEAKKEMSPTVKLAAKVVYAALNILKEKDGELPSKEIFKILSERVDFDDWALTRLESSGNLRWVNCLHFYSINCVRAGFLIKKKGVWYLTSEGEKALSLGEIGLHKTASDANKAWDKAKKKLDEGEEEKEIETITEKGTLAITFDKLEEISRDGFVSHIEGMHPYEFQDLAAALLRGMGYYTPFVAPKGKDGGRDIIAYRDPLGTTTPRIKVQVKHRQKTKASVDEIRQLIGLINKDGEVGIFISTAGFTSESKATGIGSSTHIELIDLDRFIELWKEFYPRMDEEDKGRMEMVTIQFVGRV